MNETQEKTQRDFEGATRQVHAQFVGKSGNRAEVEYGEAYQRMVVAGIAPKIKQKYSTPKKFR